MDIDYLGNLATENYTFIGSVSGADKDDWSVTFVVGDNYEETKNMTFGISDTSEGSGELLIKVKLPTGENSISYATGHNIRVLATSTTGESSSFDFKVHIPQEYLLQASGPEKVGMTSGGGTSVSYTHLRAHETLR